MPIKLKIGKKAYAKATAKQSKKTAKVLKKKKAKKKVVKKPKIVIKNKKKVVKKPKKKVVKKPVKKPSAKKDVLMGGNKNIKQLIGAFVGFKRPATNWTFKDIVLNKEDEENKYGERLGMVSEAERNFTEEMFDFGTADIDWIDNISERDEGFWNAMAEKQSDGKELTSRQEDRWNRIRDKVHMNLYPSLLKQFRTEFTKWKKKEGDKIMTQKQAIKSFRIHYGLDYNY